METKQIPNVEYPISDTMLNGKEFVRVKFQAATENTAGKVSNVRLIRAKKSLN
jgi:uncharacterized protein